MKRFSWFLVSAFLFLWAMPGGAVDNGQPAPEFSLQDINGKPVSLGKLRGKYVVLEWINHGCPFVKKHYNSGNMQALQKEFTAKGVVWLSICSSAEGKQGHMKPSAWRKVAKEKGAATAILLDEWGEVGNLYRAKTTPHMFVIDPTGLVIYQGAIDDTPSTDPADVKGAKNYVRLALDEAMEGKPVSNPTTKPYGCGVKYK